MRSIRNPLLRTLLTSALITLSIPALAAPTKAQIEEGREHFHRGVELFNDADYRAALIEFNRANDVAPNYRIQYNIAQTCLELQDYACALRALQTYVAAGGKEVSRERRQQSEREIERLKRLVATVSIRTNKDGADIALDDVSLGRAPLTNVLVGAGRHKVTAVIAPLPTVTKIVDIAGGDHVEIVLELAEPTAPPSVATAPADPVQPTPTPKSDPPRAQVTAVEPPSRVPFWIGVAATATVAAGATTVGILTLGAQSDLDDQLGRATAGNEIRDARTNVRTLSTATDILLASTIVAAGITTVLWFTTTPSRRTGRGSPYLLTF